MSSTVTYAARPVDALDRGLAAGVLGTAAMTAWQELSAKLQASGTDDAGTSTVDRDPWADAPAPAKLAKRIIEGVFEKPVSADRIPLLTNAMHWGYGTTWGAAYGLLAASARTTPPIRAGLAFGTSVWAMSYVQLVPLGLYEAPWKYPAKDLAMDLSYHLAYGAGVAAAWRLIRPR